VFYQTHVVKVPESGFVLDGKHRMLRKVFGRLNVGIQGGAQYVNSCKNKVAKAKVREGLINSGRNGEFRMAPNALLKHAVLQDRSMQWPILVAKKDIPKGQEILFSYEWHV